MSILPQAVMAACGVNGGHLRNTAVELCGETRNALVYELDLAIMDDNSDAAFAVPRQEVWFVDGQPLPVAGILGSTAMHEFVTVFREKQRIFHVRRLEDFLAPKCPHFNGAHPL